MDLIGARWVIAIWVGIILGWMAGEFWQRGMVGRLGNMVLGITGALIGVGLSTLLNLHAIGVVGASAFAFILSVALLLITNLLIPSPVDQTE
jgi:uncharacterized membrane protein YeaQ/YmgE (transglycosylase-associated protein family)